MTPAARIARYVDWGRADEYLRLGWLPSDALAGTCHEQWSIMMLWLCNCPAAEPERSERAA